MKTRILCGREAILILFFVAVFCLTAAAQWQIGEQVLSPPPRGNYYSMRLGAHAPPLPFCPSDVPVYFLGTIPGTTNLAFAYDDRDLSSAGRSSTQMTQDVPPLPGPGNGGGGGNTNPPPPAPQPCDYGTNLYLLIGLTNVVNGAITNQEAWLVLTNTESPKYYQIQSRRQLVEAPWEPGEIVQDTGTSHQVQFSNVRADDVSQRFFRGVGGDTVASIALDPDYNLAVEPASSNGSGQVGKFKVSLSPPVSAARTVLYQLSGSASNGVDYTSLGGTVSVQSNATISLAPLYAALPMADKSVTLTLVFTNGYLVSPQSASATLKIYPPRPAGMAVAIHDSGWTKLNGLSATNWNYFVLPESVKEALRSDGTPYVVVSDLDIANGVLLTTNGAPAYPILISLAAEAIRDEEIAPLANYVAAGGFILAGSSSFSRTTNGVYRTNFALASPMGLSCSPSAANWYANTWLLKLTNHILVGHLPDNVSLVWRMPAYADEINWGTCAQNFNYSAPHPIWQVSATAATTLARGDYCDPIPSCPRPYITVNSYGSGWFIYDAAMQPLVCHGGNGPSMYSYLIVRRAIEWAFESAQRPVVRLSPWPYPYDAAYMVRHDLENIVGEIANVWGSAQYENSYGAKGDYYFCTGAITDQWNYASIVLGLQEAATNYGATIGSHNGGLPNPNLSTDTNSACYFPPWHYNYFHWGPDEALDMPFGYDYASSSVSISFAQIDAWLTSYQNPVPRTWVAPYFNATREDSYQLQEQLNVKITGEQKLAPFPSWTLSTRTDGKRYSFLSEPVSDWFVAGGGIAEVAQVVGPWQDHPSGSGVHTSQTLSNAVDFYYTNGFLLNFYAHSLTYVTDGDQGGATDLMADYVAYCASSAHPRIWPINARDVYNWWVSRSTAQVTASCSTNGTHSLATVTIAGAQDPNTAIEILAVGTDSAVVSQLLTNGVAAATNSYRTVGQVIKVQVGGTITNVQAEYFPGPVARDDVYNMVQGQSLIVNTNAGVLTNDLSGIWPGLSAILGNGPSHGTLTLDPDGGFTYNPPNGLWGTECFTYGATDGQHNFGSATVTIEVAPTATSLFWDDFNRCKGTALSPWQVHSGTWSLGSGAMQGSSAEQDYGYCYVTNTWTGYSVQASVQFPAGAFGGGVGGRLNPSTGSHYAAWVYPEGSTGGSNILALIKFSTWSHWGNDPAATNYVPLEQFNLASVGTTNHTLKLSFDGNNIAVYYDDLATPKISTSDTAYSSGGISLDMWTDLTTYNLSASKLIVAPYP